jgi:hypothetical protein
VKLEEVLNSLPTKQRSSDEWRGKCPAHDGKSADSLSIGIGDNGDALLYCHGGCSYKEITAALGVPSANGHNPTERIAPPSPTLPPTLETKIDYNNPTAVYQYTDETGALLFEKCRYEPKTFRVRVKDGSRYSYRIGDTRRVLYNLPAVIASDEVFVVEGEKDADRLGAMGIVATTNFDGASSGKSKPKWDESYNPFFTGKTVYIIPDNDEPGWAHAKHIRASIADVAKRVQLIELPDVGAGGDVSDWLDGGGNVAKLMGLIDSAEIQSLSNWRLFTLEDAQKPLPPIEYVVDYFFAKHTLNIVYGAPGTMKSMILGDMCMAILQGVNWLTTPEGTEGIKTEQVPILWVDVDNGARRSHERFGALSRARGITSIDSFYYVSMPDPLFRANDITSILDLKATIKNIGAGLVVIDNLGLVTGDTEENSSGMGQVMANMRGVAEDTGAAIVMIHHQRKGNTQNQRAGDSLRGHSSIEASLDLAIHITREPNSSTISLMSTKTRGVDVPQISAEFKFGHIDGTRDLLSAQFFKAEPNTVQSPIKLAIMLALEDNPDGLNQTQLTKIARSYMDKPAAINTVRGWIKTLANGAVIASKDGKAQNEIIYYLEPKNG